MSAGKHSAGRWEAVADKPKGLNRGAPVAWRVFADDAAEGMRLAAECYGPTAEGNARLIAAAPEMLEALVALLSEVMGDDALHHSDGCAAAQRTGFGCNCAQGSARAAIAKARGGGQ
jgi:hypothetical protein